MQITKENHEGTTYYSAEHAGVEYSLYYVDSVRAWSLTSRRKSRGPRHIGSHRYFMTLAELENKIKAFRGIDAMVTEQV